MQEILAKGRNGVRFLPQVLTRDARWNMRKIVHYVTLVDLGSGVKNATRIIWFQTHGLDWLPIVWYA